MDTAHEIEGTTRTLPVDALDVIAGKPEEREQRGLNTQQDEEQRAAEEITHGFGRQTAPEGINVYNPAFDVTPAWLIKAIICERGVIEPVTREAIKQMVGGRR